MTPSYSAIRGTGWLERGGVYVVANIRGGGEFGPRWHQAALKAKRHRAYEDFEAVAADLIRRRVTSAARLGCMGGSNGGLLVGNMITRPSAGTALFGAVVCQVPLLDMRRCVASSLAAATRGALPPALPPLCAGWRRSPSLPYRPRLVVSAVVADTSQVHQIARRCQLDGRIRRSGRSGRVGPCAARLCAAIDQRNGERRLLRGC